VNRAALRKQLVCQTGVGRAVARFLGVKLANLVGGRTRAQAEARARTLLDRLTRSCSVPVALDASGVALPAVGTTCRGTIGASGQTVDPDALRACLITGLEIGIDRVSPNPPPKPNLVVILTDDQRWDTTDLTHSRDGMTPVMLNVEDRLVAS